MQIEVIQITLKNEKVTVMYSDRVNRRNNLSFSATGNPTVAKLISDCQQLLPTDSNHPQKQEILKEIAALESRAATLKQAIGQ